MNRRLAIALAAGLLNAALVYGNGYLLLDLTMDATGLELFAYEALQFLGMFAIGAGSTYLLVRFSLVGPVAVAAFFAGFSLWDHFSASMKGFTSLYLGLWFVGLGLVALVALVEYGFRAGLGLFPPEPLV